MEYREGNPDKMHFTAPSCSFTTKVLAILISRVTGNVVQFRIISPIKLKDLSISFRKVKLTPGWR
jgi:ribulose 1,5-bisphosphate carboxylase large subunit-like protein